MLINNPWPFKGTHLQVACVAVVLYPRALKAREVEKETECSLLASLGKEMTLHRLTLTLTLK